VSVFQLNARRADELARQRPAVLAKLDRTGLLDQVSHLAGVRLPVPAAKARSVGTVSRPGYSIDKIVFETEPGITVPGLLFHKGDRKAGPLTVFVSGEGMAASAAPGGRLERLMKSGRRVLALDLRGLGETAPRPAPAKGPNLFGVDFREAYMALHINRPLLGQRTHDLLAVLAAMSADAPGGTHLIGADTAGPVALHAAFFERRVARLTLEGSLISWSEVARTPISHNQLTNVVPGALKVYDLPDLAAALAPRPLTIRDAAGPVGRPVPLATVSAAYGAARAAYARAKAEAALVVGAGREGE
jgi:pimeloyl-ACP methyl ester carboxylesterase